jgi:protein gp37
MIFCLLSPDYKPTWISDFFMMRQHVDALSSGVVQPYHSQYSLELQRHRQQDSTVPSSAWLGSTVTNVTRQHRRQHDSASISRHGQVIPATLSLASLSSTIASMTWHLHHIVTKSPWQCHRQHDSATPSPVWLGISVAPSPAWLDIDIMQQLDHQHQ